MVVEAFFIISKCKMQERVTRLLMSEFITFHVIDLLMILECVL
jgi:hypothetical protein